MVCVTYEHFSWNILTKLDAGLKPEPKAKCFPTRKFITIPTRGTP